MMEHICLSLLFQTYVQDIAAQEAESIYHILARQEGHVYVCGDVTMAENVYTTIRLVLEKLIFSISG